MRIDYRRYKNDASGLASEIVSKHTDSLPETITEALCRFAENAVQEELKRVAVILERSGWVDAAREIRMMSAPE